LIGIVLVRNQSRKIIIEALLLLEYGAPSASDISLQESKSIR
jgi:hypothetical protein